MRTTSADDLRAWVRVGRGALYEPDRIDFADALPLTDAGKPGKKRLRDQATDQNLHRRRKRDGNRSA